MFLIASNGICSDTSIQTLNVQYDCATISLNAAFSTNTDTIYLNGFSTVTFTNTSSNSTSWQWDFGDGSATSPFENPSHTYTDAGTYTVTLTAYNSNCSDVSTTTIIVIGVTPGIAEGISENNLKIYPNPNDGSFSAEINFEKPTDFQMELTNVLGQHFFDSKYNQLLSYQIAFDLSDVPNGIYFMKMQTENGFIIKKIIIN
ncbi:MAG: hypothetical protein COA57_08170 [Flavobacteriales bacterium]|nr:MAG: hypothetical protein COA57_08170 [Flavobacteriales bacterium]